MDGRLPAADIPRTTHSYSVEHPHGPGGPDDVPANQHSHP